MKNFFTSYWIEVLKPNFNWATDHWKGLIILTTILTAIEAVIIFWSDISEWVRRKIEIIKPKRFTKKRES